MSLYIVPTPEQHALIMSHPWLKQDRTYGDVVSMLAFHFGTWQYLHPEMTVDDCFCRLQRAACDQQGFNATPYVEVTREWQRAASERAMLSKQ
jgi:hypothetical protein